MAMGGRGRRKQNFQNSCVVRRYAGAGKHFKPNPFGERAPACAGRPRGGRGFRAGPGRVISGPVQVRYRDSFFQSAYYTRIRIKRILWGIRRPVLVDLYSSDEGQTDNHTITISVYTIPISRVKGGSCIKRSRINK